MWQKKICSDLFEVSDLETGRKKKRYFFSVFPQPFHFLPPPLLSFSPLLWLLPTLCNYIVVVFLASGQVGYIPSPASLPLRFLLPALNIGNRSTVLIIVAETLTPSTLHATFFFHFCPDLSRSLCGTPGGAYEENHESAAGDDSCHDLNQTDRNGIWVSVNM